MILTTETVAKVIVLTLFLAGCTSTLVVDTACTAFQPITYSAANDTEETKAQIRGHNAAWKTLCRTPAR